MADAKHRSTQRDAASAGFPSLTRLFLGVLAIVFFGETVVMFIVPPLLTGKPPWIPAIADAALLALLTAPCLWWIILSPLRRTERAQAAEDYRVIVRTALDGFWLLDTQGRLLDVNDAYCHLTGYSRDELLRMRVTDLEAAETSAETARRIGKVMAVGWDRFETRHRCKDGRIVDFEVGVNYTEGGGGRFFAFLRDITERNRAEDALRRAHDELEKLVQERTAELKKANTALQVEIVEHKRTELELQEGEKLFRTSVENMQDAFGIYSTIRDESGRIIDFRVEYVNAAACAANLMTKEEQIGKRLLQLLPAHQESGLFDEYCQVVETGRPLIKESLLYEDVFGGGQLLRRAFDIRAVKLGDGFVAAWRNITDRKQAAETLHRSEERYRSLVEATAQVVWQTAADGQVADDLPTWRAYTGQSKEEIRGWGWTTALHPDDVERAVQVWSRCVKTRSLYEIEYRVRGADGNYRHFHTRGVPVLEENGSIREWVGTCTDITERKRAEEAIRKLNAELEQRVIERTAQLVAVNRELEAFSYSVSHDLRAPLRHIAGYVQLLGKHASAALDEKGARYLEVISGSVKRMGSLIDDLLAFSRVGRAEMKKTAVSLAALVEETRRDLREEMERRDVSWQAGPLPEVYGDRALLRLVLANLLSNALKFTKPRPRAVIEIGCTDGDHDEVVIFVRDNGVGFDMKYAGKLFGVFQRLHSSDEFEGTGIGLANVRRVIERHGGRTWAEGGIGAGATVFFSLPKMKEG